ncbi:BatA and WFA domain-containing protein [Bacillus sp. 03113]|uniref:vWA domain-containing protein n=1 Tax=Bacillus sp. 03113 TaxID=2578211 RepID=UPI0011414F11|nr:BatA and WFA domain-containing protein [Bacillus sp. 03113]
MHFAFPFYFLFTIFIGAVIVFYFFRKQYKQVPISSNMLWKEVLNEWQASPWLKKLQHNLLFWLQILALLLLMLALVRPFWHVEGLKGEEIIFITDTSASMSALHQNRSRLEMSKESMLEMVDQLKENQTVTIIEASEKPNMILTGESDLKKIRKKIEQLHLSYGHENMNKSLQMASSLSNGKETSIHVFTDSVSKSDVSSVIRNRYIEIHTDGEKEDNFSILSFGVSEQKGVISGAAMIENQSVDEQSVLLQVISQKNILFEKVVTLKAHEKQFVHIPTLMKEPYYELTIKAKDPYEADNHQIALYQEKASKLYTLQNTNPFVTRALQTIGADLIQLPSDSQELLETDGVLVGEGSSISSDLKHPLLFFNQNKASKITLKEPLKMEEDPILQYVNLAPIYIDSASQEMKGDWTTLVHSGNIPLIQKGFINGQPVIVVNFSVEQTDWPLSPSFPIFLYNSFQWLSERSDFLGNFEPGEKKWLNLDSASTNWEIFDHEGSLIDSYHSEKENFTAPLKPGLYQAVSNDQVRYFSVSLDEREKNIDVKPSFHLNDQKQQEKNLVQKQTDFIWIWLASLALILLFIEWEVYRRGY